MKLLAMKNFRVFKLLAGRTGVSERRDGGYTLVELMIYSSLLVLILTAVGGMLLNTLTAEDRVISSGNASSTSQLISASIHSGVRNATAMNLIEYPGGDQRLRLKTLNSDPDSTTDARVCQTWYYAESKGGAMYYNSVPAGLTAPITLTVSSDMHGWMLMGQGLSSRADEPIFTTDPDTDGITEEWDPVNVTLNFTINEGDTSSPVVISTTVVSRQSEDLLPELKCF